MLEGDKVFEEFKGSLTEQYVLQQLKTLAELPVYYWANDSGSAELDFIIQISRTKDLSNTFVLILLSAATAFLILAIILCNSIGSGEKIIAGYN